VRFFYNWHEWAATMAVRTTTAGFGPNHFRVVRRRRHPIRCRADKFGLSMAKPFICFGSTVRQYEAVAGRICREVPVTWLGRPGAPLQVT